ncbi:type 4 prepilin-like proteins leader peptide-processing enzyme [Synergistales bacterium]|nr:type 4 prepilin-like proteins leader peptide-processing enzyme [Synergistales bacterium]
MNDLLLSSQIPGVIAILTALFSGACAGSFINATAMRAARGRKWWGSERSCCDKCGRTLSAADLVPIFSFIFLRGKCRYCGNEIARRHFAAEAVSSVLTCGLFIRWGLSPALVLSLAALWFGLFNSLTDIENGFIYDWGAIPLGLIGIALRLAYGGRPAALDGVYGAALGFGVIAVIILISRGGMGWGDAVLMLGIGGAMGLRYCALSLYAGFFAGGIVILPLLIMKRVTRKDAVPLGPFLAAGSVFVLFTGSFLVRHLAALLGRDAGWPWM